MREPAVFIGTVRHLRTIGADPVKRLSLSHVTSVFLIAALTAGPLAAQQKSQQPPPEMPKITENIDVRVIGVDVVVTDKKGNPVTGLTKDDFQIFENGIEKPISNFYEIEGKAATQAVVVPVPGATGTPPPPKEEINEQLTRRIILYIDNLSLAPVNRINDAQSYNEAVADARSYASSVEHDLRQSVESINGLLTTLAGVDGKKILVLTTEGFQMQPGRELFTLIDEVAKDKGWQSSSLIEGMSFNSGSLIESIAKTANANGITLYAIHAGGLAAGNEGMSADNQKPVSYTVTSAALSNSTESLQMLAELTGGLATIRTNNFVGGFKDIIRDLNSYYSLGYRAGTDRVDRQRALEVRVKNKALHVRSRQTFVEKSTFQEMSDRVIANLLYKTKANDLGVHVNVKLPIPAEELYKVPVEVRIPIDNLALLQQGEAFMGGFSIYVVVGNKDGDMSDVSRKSHQITIPAGEFAKAKGKYYTYSLDLMCERGLNKISIGVVDDVSNISGFDRQQVIAQNLQ